MDTPDTPEPTVSQTDVDTPNADSNADPTPNAAPHETSNATQNPDAHSASSHTAPPTPNASRRSTNGWRIDLLALATVLMIVAMVGARAMGLLGGQDGDDAVGDDASLEQAMDTEVLPEPPPGPVALDWAIGIQTWLHWYSIPVGDHQLGRLNDQGFDWVKQRFAWADMQHSNPHGDFDYGFPPLDFTHTDAFLDGIERSWPDARVLIQLDFAPAWAHLDDPEPGYSPIELSSWWDFVYLVARRYGDRIHAFEILNEPNLRHPESWPWTPDPAAYAQILYEARSALLEAASDALVISAGLSPTGDRSADAMPDDEYLEALYDAMEMGQYGDTDGHSDDYFDALGAHAPGFRAAPEVAPEEAAADPQLGGERFFTFRRVEDLRAIMEARGDAHKKIVITELSWTTDTRPESPYAWSAVDPATRTDYLRRALDWAARHWAPWIGPIVLFSAPDRAWTADHEASWRALTDDRGELTHKLAIWDIAPPTAAERGELAIVDAAPVALEVGAVGVPLERALPDIDELNEWHGATPSEMALGDGLLAVAMGHRFRLADITNPDAPNWIHESEAFPAVIDGLALDGALLAVSGAFGVHVYGVDTGAPQLSHTIAHPVRVVDLSDGELLATSRACVDSADGAASDDASRGACLSLLRFAIDQRGDAEPLTAIRLPADAPWAVHDGLLLIAGGLDSVPSPAGTVVVLDLRSPVGSDPAAMVLGEIAVDEHVVALVPYDGGVLAVGADSGSNVPSADGFYMLSLTAIDLRDRSTPALAGVSTIETMNSTWIGGAGAAVAVIDRVCYHSVCDGSTAIVDLRDPAAPTVVGGIESSAQHLPSLAAIAGTVVVIDDGNALALHTLHQDRDESITLLSGGILPLPLIDGAMAVLDVDAMVAVSGLRLQVVDVAPEDRAATYGAFHVRGSTEELSCGEQRVWAGDVTVLGQYAYVAAWEAGLIVVDVSDRDAPKQVACLSGRQLPDGGKVATDGRHIYVAGSHGGPSQQDLWKVDVGDPTQPVIIGHTILGGPERAAGGILDLAAIDGIVYAAVKPAYDQGLHIVNMRDPANPRPVAAPRVPEAAATVAIAPGWVALGSAPCDEGVLDCQPTVRIYKAAEDPRSSSGPTDLATQMLNEVAVLSLPVPAQGLAFASLDNVYPEVWIAGAAGTWPVDLSDPAAPYTWPATAGNARHVLSLPDGRIVLSGPDGLREHWASSLWR